MLQIQRQDVAEVADWDADQFAVWLTTEIPVALEGPPNRYPFRPLHYLFAPAAPLWSVLADIAEAMDARCRTAFRAGLARAIDRLRATEDDFASLQVLLQLVRAIGCTEACDAIVRKLGGQGLGAPAFPHAQKGFELALVTVAGLTPGQASRAALQALVTSTWFDPSYAPTALVALARSDFDLLKHLKLLGSSLREEECHSVRMKRMFQELIDIVPLSELALRCTELALYKRGWFFASLTAAGLRVNEDDQGVFTLMRFDGSTATLHIAPDQESETVFFLSAVADRQIVDEADPRLTELLASFLQEAT